MTTRSSASSTPPVTPDSQQEQITNISVRIVTEPKYKNKSQSQQQLVQQQPPPPAAPSSSMSTVSSVYTAPPVATISVPDDADDDDNDTRVTLNSVPESTLVQTVLMGIGCSPALSFLDGPSMNMSMIGDGGLMVIPENDYFSPPALWGMAPSDDDEETNTDEGSWKNGNMHEDFELVLEEDESFDSSHVPQPPPAPRNLQNNSEHGHFFCQPISPERTVDITTRNSRALGVNVVNPTNLYAEDPHSQTMRMQQEQSQQQQQSQQRGRRAIRFKSTPEVWSPSPSIRSSRSAASISTTKSQKSQDSKGSKMAFFLFRSNSTSGSGTGTGTGSHNQDNGKSSKNRSKLFRIKYKKKSKNQQQRSKSATVIKAGRWKAVKDEASGKYYFYHTKTRQVTWTTPQGFVEWKATLDKQTGRHYFYNTITKETTWTKPSEFQEWKQVVSNTGRPYFYNVLTRVTAWHDPSKDTEHHVAVASSDTKESSTGVKSEPIQNAQRSLSVEDNTTTIIVQRNTTAVEPSKMKSLPEVEQTEKECPEDEIDNTGKTTTPMISPEVAENTVTSNASRSKDSDRLAKLLSEYCPQQEDRNEALLSKVQGNESLIVLGIQGLVEETPFDELHGAIAAYIKEADLVEDPYQNSDANKRDGLKSGPKTSTPPITHYKPTKFHRVATAVSQKSVKTSATDQTNRVNNTTRNFVKNIEKTLTKEAPIESSPVDNQLNSSFEELTDNSIDHEKGNVIFDMNLMNDSNHDGQSFEKKERGDIKGALVDPKNGDSTKQKQKKNFFKEPISSKMNDPDEHTIESAYAGDINDDTDKSWHDNDTMSALSDSIGGAFSKRRQKEKARQSTKKPHRPLARRKVTYL